MNGDVQILEWRSPNFNGREGAPIDMLVLHYTGMKTCAEALERLCDPAAEVSAHYLIDEDGNVYDLVGEEARAWHAGVASWRGETNVNSRSIGIELVNPGHEWGYREFPAAQTRSLLPLCQDIVQRHGILPRNVVGHSDVAPTRKLDPGELFDWAMLAGAGVGLWPDTDNLPEPCEDYEVLKILVEIGYDVSNEPAAIAAFQRHFRPRWFDGNPDEETRRTLAAVRALI
ncbi:MAG: N-acetylmuramoyl-L-alanine amidase [Rhodospirillales bacterium]|nr:N-acetylmuramoyl-L-alanine amidase [Rhodospirillales bacterium]